MQFSITITGEKHELADSLAILKAVMGEQIGGRTVTTAVQPPAQPAPAPYAPLSPVTTSAGTVTPMPTAPTVPVQPPAAAPLPPVTPPAPTVPTSETTYTMEQLAVAATPLNDAGRGPDLTTLLNQFGVQSLTQLPKEHYGAFATALRQMGAKI